MLRGANRMHGYRIRAVDGEIGKVSDWYFEDDSWAVRYLVADTGHWLPGRLVLLAPTVVATIDEDAKAIEVGLTREQINASPPAETHEPVSRQYEEALQQHYGWPAYWAATGGLAGTPQFDPIGPSLIPGDTALIDQGGRKPEPRGDPHLRSAREVSGYAIHATDGDIGEVSNLVIDDEDWLVRYVVVDTKPWWPGGNVLVDTGKVREVNWNERAVVVDLPRDEIRTSPPYDASHPMNRELQRKRYESHRS